MFSFGWSINHAEFVSNLSTYWAMLNPYGITSAIITVICGVGVYVVFKSLGDDDKDNADEQTN